MSELKPFLLEEFRTILGRLAEAAVVTSTSPFAVRPGCDAKTGGQLVSMLRLLHSFVGQARK